MYSTLVSVALFSALAIQGALAEFNVDTPTITQCQAVQFKWASTGAKSYNVAIVPAADPCGDLLRDLGDHTGTSMTWTADIAAGQKVMLSILDSDDNEAWSGEVTVQDSGNTSCLAAVASSVASSAVAVSSSTRLSAAAATASTGTTLVVNPAAAPSTSGAPAAPSSSGGASAVGAANSGLLGNGAFSVRFSAPSVALGAIVAVAALAF